MLRACSHAASAEAASLKRFDRCIRGAPNLLSFVHNDLGRDDDAPINQVLLFMRRGTLLILLALTIVGIAVAIGIFILHGGLSAKATPTILEAFLARNA